jgi:hypothetical protein
VLKRLVVSLVIAFIQLLGAFVSLGAQTRPGRLAGVVFDSVAMRPLAHAMVQLLSSTGASLAMQADSVGRFRFDSVDAGNWAIGALHPRLDSLGVRELTAAAVVRAGRETRTTISVPTPYTMVSKVCSARAANDSTGYVLGTLRSATAGARPTNGLGGVPGVVRFAWVELFVSGEGTKRSLTGVEVTADSTGRFVACGIPAATTVQVRAWDGADTTGLLELRMPAAPIVARDFFVGPAERVKVAARIAEADSQPSPSMTTLRGAGRVRGSARRSDGQPLGGVRVTVWSTSQEVVTGPDGSFALDALPIGSYMLEARALGFEPTRIPLDILVDNDQVLDVSLNRLAALDTIRINADRQKILGRDMMEFEERRKSGFGRFIGPEDIERRQPLRLTDLLRTVPGVRIVLGGISGEYPVMRGLSWEQWCQPDILVDRMLVSDMGAQLEFFAPVWEVRAIEVYPNPSTVPSQFTRPGSGCGAIVIWTGPRTILPPKRDF